MATKQEIQNSIGRLMKAFTAFKPDPEDMRGFMELVYEKLSPFSNYIIEQAIEEIIENEIYFPRLAEMISKCWQVRDKLSQQLWNRWQTLKTDWYDDRIHPREVWQKLADDYKQIFGYASAEEVMADCERYSKPGQRISAEQYTELKTKLKSLGEKMEVK